jgi:hypothetical protein
MTDRYAVVDKEGANQHLVTWRMMACAVFVIPRPPRDRTALPKFRAQQRRTIVVAVAESETISCGAPTKPASG